MGLFKRKSANDLNDIAILRAEMTDMQSQLDATTRLLVNRTSSFDQVTQRMADVDDLKLRIAHLDAISDKLDSLESVNSQLAELSERVAISAVDARQANDQAATLHERISNVSTELANQLGELSREIDGLNGRHAVPSASSMPPPPAPLFESAQAVPPELVDQLRSSQVKLANEQARYEIAFRQDLAMLAEQVKRSLTEPNSDQAEPYNTY